MELMNTWLPTLGLKLVGTLELLADFNYFCTLESLTFTY